MMNILIKIPAVLVMAGIFILSSLPGDDLLLNSFNLNDKVKHFIAYFVLGITLCIWISRKSWFAKPFFWSIFLVVLCTVFGILDEFHQSFVPGRSGNDFGDLTADFIGGFVSVFLYLLLMLKRQSSRKV
jgi:VanZ family protein